MIKSMENMEAKITKRLATQEDTDFARNVHHTAYHDVILKQFGNWDEAMQNGFFDKSWKPETHEIILSDEAFCGYCSIEHKSDHIFVHELVLSPEFQGKGIGSKLLKEIIEEAKVKGISVRLQVLKENQAQNLYRKLGFKDTTVTDTHVEMELVPTINA